MIVTLNFKTIMKARIYQNREDGRGIILSGEVVSFYLGTEGWNLVMKDSRVAEEHPELFEVILDLNNDKMLKGEWGKEPKSKAEIGKDSTVWIGFRFNSEKRVQIYEGNEE